MWQLPVPVSMVGTVAFSTTALINPAPPRGITTSTSPRARMRWVTLDRSSDGSNCTASAGRPAAVRVWRRIRTSSALELAADDEPRSSATLPDFSAMPKASTVTFGRAS